MHVELADVVADGRRLQSRQRRRVVLASVAALALLGGGAGVFDARNADQTAPASTTGPGTVTVALNKDVFSFRLSDGGRVHFGRVVQGTNRITSETAATAVNGQAWVIVKDRPNVVLGVLPALEQTSHVDVIARPGMGESYGSPDQELARGLKAYVREFANSEDAAAFKGRVFVDAQARVHGPGGVLPMATFATAESGDVSVWVDRTAQVFGTLSQGQLSARVHPLSGDGVVAQETGRIYGLLPAGASRVQVTFNPKVEKRGVLQTKQLGGDWVAFSLDYRAGRDGQTNGTVVWRDRSGKEHTAIAG
jgi:hypothetical protein